VTAVTLLAPAKLTLSLRVTGVRDDGLHLIDAEMVTLDLYDVLEIDPAGSGLTVQHDHLSTGAVEVSATDNLVTRALRLAKTDAAVLLTKYIPSGAGLGGGSADAAAVLRWAGFTDVERAATIGADVAFCLLGGRARVSGIGEIVEPLPFSEATFTVVTPAVHNSTAAVYAMWDLMGGPTGAGSNDLEEAAIRVSPELAQVRDKLGDATGTTPELAGSGSSWFVAGAFPDCGRVLHALPPNTGQEAVEPPRHLG